MASAALARCSQFGMCFRGVEEHATMTLTSVLMSSQKEFGEVLVGLEGRRRWSDDQKREIVSESLQEGAMALAVAQQIHISLAH